jgi:sulfhydrogenase subunit delta
MDRDIDRRRLLEQVYGEAGLHYDSMPTRSLSDVVKVDLKITGCPIEKEQLLLAVSNLLNGDPPVFPEYPVCGECKMRENNCLLIERNEICCGPLTVAGCNARCPELGVACVGCRGPADDANIRSALAMFADKGIARDLVAKKLRTFAPVRVDVAGGNGGGL